MLSFFWQFEKFGTGEGLLWYGICARCKKQASVYAARFQGHSVRRTGFCGTEGIFGTGNALLWYGVHLQSAVQERASTFLAFVAFGAGNALLFLAV